MTTRNVINIFATRSDLEPGIRAVERTRDLQYVLCGLFDHPEYSVFRSLLDLEDLGVLMVDDHIRGPRYLVLNAGRTVEVRAVPQRRGGTKYAIDQLINPGSMTVLPGGLRHDQGVLAGQIGTVATDREAISLFKDYSRAVTKGFRKVRGYLIGPEALQLSSRGLRLTTGLRSPQEYDIRP